MTTANIVGNDLSLDPVTVRDLVQESDRAKAYLPSSLAVYQEHRLVLTPVSLALYTGYMIPNCFSCLIPPYKL